MSAEPSVRPPKPLGSKSYGSIPHLPGSRMGPADHHCHEGQARIATEKVRDKRDRVIVQEKVDGSCCAVARIGDDILALGRAGYLAASSPFEQHHRFADWVATQRSRFASLLAPGERVVGEWMAQAHGTRYDLPHEPFVVFDLMVGPKRATWFEATSRAEEAEFVTPVVLRFGPMSVDDAVAALEWSGHGALDPVEGAVWRVERDERVDFLVKYVRPDKVDGCYLPELNGGTTVWNTYPGSAS
jgi:hypothetical protein